MPRFKLLIEYDGTRYCGWQRQNSDPSIQAEVERALAVALGNTVPITGSGRTDAGVHARGQVAHFDVEDDLDVTKTRGSLNGLLPEDISVSAVTRTDEAFHARFSAIARTYHYYVATRPTALERNYRQTVPESTDFDLMNRCAHAIVGRHDFSSFCRTQSATKNRVCTIKRAEWRVESIGTSYSFVIEGDRFLHGMVRTIVGTLLEISRGKREVDSVPRILASRDRREAGEAAPAKGLVLERVSYPD